MAPFPSSGKEAPELIDALGHGSSWKQ